MEDVEAGSDAASEEIGLGERHAEIARGLAARRRQLDVLAAAEEVALGNRALDVDALVLAARRVAGADGELASRLFDEIDHEDDLVGFRTRHGRDLDPLEIIQPLEAPLGALHEHLVEGVAFADVELATHNVVARAGVAADLDALDIGARTLVHGIDDGDRAVLEVAVAARRDLREGIAHARETFGQPDDGVLDILGAVDVARMALNQRVQRIGTDAFDRALDRDVAEGIALTLFHRDGDGVLVGLGVQLAIRRHDAKIGIAAIVIEAAQCLFVGPQAVFVIDVVAEQERQDGRFLGGDHVAETAVAEGLVADEIDGGDLGAPTLVDLEHDVHAILAQIHGARRDRRVLAADAGVGLADGLDVGIHLRLGERRTRLELHVSGKLGVLDLLVALEQDVVDDRIFVDLDHQGPAGLTDTHVGEQAGREQALHRLVDVRVGKLLARRDADVAADGCGVDALVATHFDAADHGGLRRGNRDELGRDHTRYDETGGQSRRRNGVLELVCCLHRANKPFLVVPTARNPGTTSIS